MTTRYDDLRVEKAISAGGVVFRHGSDGVEIVLCGRTAERLWALPKGTPEPDESLEQTALSEVREETGLQIKIGTPFFVSEWRPIVKEEPWQIIGIFFECFADSPKITMSEDHDKHEWIDATQYKSYKLIPNLHAAFEAYLAKNTK